MRKILCSIAILLAGCNGVTPASAPATADSAAATPAPAAVAPASAPASPLAGSWSGSAKPVVNWVQKQDLAVRLEIAADGTVTGTIGDATLVDAKIRPGRGSIQKSLGWGRDFRIHGKLEGDLIKAEHIHRDAIDVVFNQIDDGTLKGGLTSSGSEFGGKSSMKLAAGNMTLQRQTAQAVDAKTEAAAPKQP